MTPTHSRGSRPGAASTAPPDAGRRPATGPDDAVVVVVGTDTCTGASVAPVVTLSRPRPDDRPSLGEGVRL